MRPSVIDTLSTTYLKKIDKNTLDLGLIAEPGLGGKIVSPLLGEFDHL